MSKKKIKVGEMMTDDDLLNLMGPIEEESTSHKDILAKIGDAIDNDGEGGRIDALIDLLHVASCISGKLSDESHYSHLEYLKSARTSSKNMEDRKWASQYKKDAEVLAQAAHDLQKLRGKLANKIDR